MKGLSFLLLCLLGMTNVQAQTRADRLRARYINPGPDDANRIWIMAHRGAWDEAHPESSLQSFRNAVTYGFEILELDVRFSARYKIENGVQVADPNGPNREIILQHDKANNRLDSMDGFWKYVPGLYKFTKGQQFNENALSKLDKNDYGFQFNMLDKLVPYRDDQVNCIDGPGGVHPVLLKLDATESKDSMVHFPHDARVATNYDFRRFYNAVYGNILLNFDKLSEPIDFQQTYDVMKDNGLLPQCIFKAKGLVGYDEIMDKFDGRDLKAVMYTPIFTKYDLTTEKKGVLTHQADNSTKLYRAIEVVNSLMDAEAAGLIIFPGCEIVYETEDTNDPLYGWLPALADYVKNEKHKRVVQFSTNLESKLGAWSGNSNSWSKLIGIDVNYWSWLFNNPSPAMQLIKANVFVGDKPLEFRSYLNSLGYNQKPIQ